MLSRLPRESAPGDLADPLQSQLEREVLLGGEPFEESRAALPGIRWSQYLAVAAIVLLALGLGVIVYLVLPPKHPVLTFVPPPENLDEQHEAAAGGRASGSAAEAAKSAMGGDVAAVAREGVVVAEADKLSAGAMTGPLVVLEDNTGATGAITVNTAAFFQESPGNETVVVTIKAADVRVVNEELVRYLSANKIAWSAAESQLVTLTEDSLPATSARPVTPSMGALAQMGVGLARKPSEIVDNSADSRSATETAAVEQVAQLAQRHRMLAGDASVQAVMLAKENLQFTRNERVILARDLNSRQLTELTATLSQSPHKGQEQATPAVAFFYAKAEAQRGRGATTAPAAGYDLAMAGPTTLPTTAPVDGLLVATSEFDRGERQYPTTMPTTRALAFELAATQPATIAGSFNCVIVLEDTEQVGATTQPAAEESSPRPTTMPSVPTTNPVSEQVP